MPFLYKREFCEAVFESCRFLFRQIKYCQYYAAAAMPCKLKPVGARCKCSINACTFAWICAVYQVKCRAGLKVFMKIRQLFRLNTYLCEMF